MEPSEWRSEGTSTSQPLNQDFGTNVQAGGQLLRAALENNTGNMAFEAEVQERKKDTHYYYLANNGRVSCIFRIPLYSALYPTREIRILARNVLHFTSLNQCIDEKMLRCRSCCFLPSNPVTGRCGHLRCLECVQIESSNRRTITFKDCPCGETNFESPHVNILARDIIQKLVTSEKNLRTYIQEAYEESTRRVNLSAPAAVGTTIIVTQEKLHDAIVQFVEQSNDEVIHVSTYFPTEEICRLPITVQDRLNYAYHLKDSKLYVEAATQAAKVATGETTKPEMAREARKFLEQMIWYIHKHRGCARTESLICDLIITESARSWLREEDLECVLCYETLSKPVTTPCGHTFCKVCLERALDYRSVCPLCKTSLINFDLNRRPKMNFIQAALRSIGAEKVDVPLEPNVIPIFVCTVAFPGIPCSLYISNPRYWLMIRRVLQSRDRTFGMIQAESGYAYCNYGTVLQVRDSIQLRDGSYILTTMGVSRFKIVQTYVYDGCDVAKIERLADVGLRNRSSRNELNNLATKLISKKFALWIKKIPTDLLDDIIASYGYVPEVKLKGDWWNKPDGPMWHWWIIAILPIRPEVKILILSTNSLHKRLTAVSRTLNTILQSKSFCLEPVEEHQEEMINTWLRGHM